MPKKIPKSKVDPDYSPRNYIVENILEYRLSNGLEEVLILWKGYGKDETTWEPISNIKNLKESNWEDVLEAAKDRYYHPDSNKTKVIKPDKNRRGRPPK